MALSACIEEKGRGIDLIWLCECFEHYTLCFYVFVAILLLLFNYHFLLDTVFVKL